MFRKRRRTGVPPLNTTSTADISFMLLIFFLVTTSMGADKAIRRELPPPDPKQENVVQTSPGDVRHIVIRAGGVVEVDGKVVQPVALCADFSRFIEEKGRSHVFQIEADREAPYQTYYTVQDAVQRAYRTVRDKRARQTYACGYEQLSDQQKLSVDKAVPQRIAEVFDQPADNEEGQPAAQPADQQAEKEEGQ